MLFRSEAMAAGVNYNNAIFSQILPLAQKDISVLDFGAGRGTFANRIDHHIVCVEPDPGAAAQISSKHTILSELDGQHEGGFDLIYSINVLEHLEDDQAALNQIAAILKTSGCLYLFVPARSELYSAMDRRVGHFRRYSRRQLESMVSQAGLRVEACAYFDCLGYAASLLLKLLGVCFGWRGGLTSAGVGFYDTVIFPVSRRLDAIAGRLLGKNLMLKAVKL